MENSLEEEEVGQKKQRMKSANELLPALFMGSKEHVTEHVSPRKTNRRHHYPSVAVIQ